MGRKKQTVLFQNSTSDNTACLFLCAAGGADREPPGGAQDTDDLE